MPIGDYVIILAVGAGFAVLGLAGILWGRHEEKNYFDALSEKPDMREFMDHWPERPQPGAVRVGGWIALAAGCLVVLTGLALWLLKVPV